MNAINAFLLQHDLRIVSNPCISPDFCLDWDVLSSRLKRDEGITRHIKSGFSTSAGDWMLAEDVFGDHAWVLTAPATAGAELEDGIELNDRERAFPATWRNLLHLKNLVQQSDSSSTIFPSAAGRLGRSTLGIGARFTTLHWPGVDWAMAHLGFGVTANQNSVPRELVYDVDVMLSGRLGRVAFPFLGTEVPEGHQGQSVEGMSHGCVLAKLKTGFHRRRIAWSFNADHQPVGGKFDEREEALVRGSILASYITFDLSPELNATPDLTPDVDARVWVESAFPAEMLAFIRRRVESAGLSLVDSRFFQLLRRVGPALMKMKRRDDLYREARERTFTTETGRAYLRELSIDELPGLTTPETTAVLLAACEALGMKIHFVAPAFGFQKNLPFPDNAELRRRVEAQWAVCKEFGTSIGFHSGSGKSAENYRILGEVTGGCLEIKTSGRYTYEMGRALAASRDERDAQLWREWHAFTCRLASAGAFSSDPVEQAAARGYISQTLGREFAFADESECLAALGALSPSPEHPVWFEYNFLFVLAAGGLPEKSALGDHGPEGYAQRARFYAVSDEAKLLFAKNVAAYILFLAESTGLTGDCSALRGKLDAYATPQDFTADIGA